MKEDTQFILAVVTLGGFVIQRFLEITDPLFRAIARWLQERFKNSACWKFTYVQAKAFVDGLAAVIIGIVIAFAADLQLPRSSLELFDNPWVLGLLIASGTEGTNILVKYFNYLKEDRRRRAQEPARLP